METILDKTERVLKLRNYSPKTCKAYLLYIKEYIRFSKNAGIKNKQKAIEEFLLDKHKRKQSPQTINLALNAVKFLYAEVLKDPQKIDLKFAKISKKLPIVLSRAEIEKIIEATDNPKYKLMISLGYACGLRVSEVINLRVADLDIGELVVHVKGAKGKKDRISVLPEKLQNDLRNTIAGKNANNFVFASNSAKTDKIVKWRRGKDSNLRNRLGFNTLAVCRFRPLSHLSDISLEYTLEDNSLALYLFLSSRKILLEYYLALTQRLDNELSSKVYLFY